VFFVRDGKARKWVLFFAWFGIHICWIFLYFIGIPGTFMLGILSMLDIYAKGWNSLGTAVLFGVIFAGVCLFSSIYLIKRVHFSYRNGESDDKFSRSTSHS
jgi:predicted CDP-diglyceride synthetase/phosphatidate cytidylyltransferase